MIETPKLSTVGDPGTHRSLRGPFNESPRSWILRIEGQVERRCELTLAELQAMSLDTMALQVRCVSAGAIYQPRGELARFGGVYLDRIIQRVGVHQHPGARPAAQAVRFFSKAPGQCGPACEPHDTSLEWELCRMPRQVLLAWQLDGQSLSYENGGPLRTVVDGTAFDGRARYFYKSLKWLARIEFVSQPIAECPGTWERYAGYGVRGRVGDPRVDPFFKLTDEQGIPRPVADPASRFVSLLSSGDLSRVVAAELETVVGDFLTHPQWTPGLTFASGRDEAGQPRYRAALRGTNFRGRDLRDWDFSYVNFSLSSFTEAILGDPAARRAAKLINCDLEGAVFYAADLRNVDMTGAYLAGARFCGDGGSKPAQVEGLVVRGAQGLSAETARWLASRGGHVSLA